ncbi:hypothetical protein DPX16_1320 [Anabarilius grahami]|uniref:Uncharacterized protein n=1 Tax=Anabarilius grahami TaxID=495550 RepID=A0A3N0Y7E6_ANAGA|nr:hypothetical protein DPX16_1320 [Anabarilius grahami]
MNDVRRVLENAKYNQNVQPNDGQDGTSLILIYALASLRTRSRSERPSGPEDAIAREEEFLESYKVLGNVSAQTFDDVRARLSLRTTVKYLRNQLNVSVDV